MDGDLRVMVQQIGHTNADVRIELRKIDGRGRSGRFNVRASFSWHFVVSLRLRFSAFDRTGWTDLPRQARRPGPWRSAD